MLLTFRPLKGKKKIMRLNVNEDKDVHTNLVYVDISSKCEVSIFDKKWLYTKLCQWFLFLMKKFLLVKYRSKMNGVKVPFYWILSEI